MSSHVPRVVRDASLDWVKFDAVLARDGSVDPVDKALYAALSTFVDKNTRSSTEDPEGNDVPTRKALAACIGRDVRAVDRATARLEASGLIKVERRRDPDNPKLHLPSVYHLLDHHRWDARAAERHANRRGGNRTNPTGGGVTHVATPGVISDATPSDMSDATPSDTSDARGSVTSDAVPSSFPEALTDLSQKRRAGSRVANRPDVARVGEDEREIPRDDHERPAARSVPAAREDIDGRASTRAEEIGHAWARARREHGHRAPAETRRRVAAAALALLADRDEPADADRLEACAVDMARKASWTNLTTHWTHYQPEAVRTALPPWCGRCNDGADPGPNVAARILWSADDRVIQCPDCHPKHAAASVA
jgi:hypothetical protein